MKKLPMLRIKLDKTYTVKHKVSPYLTEILSHQQVSFQSRNSNSIAATQQGLCPECMSEINGTCVITKS